MFFMYFDVLSIFERMQVECRFNLHVTTLPSSCSLGPAAARRSNAALSDGGGRGCPLLLILVLGALAKPPQTALRKGDCKLE